MQRHIVFVNVVIVVRILHAVYERPVHVVLAEFIHFFFDNQFP